MNQFGGNWTEKKMEIVKSYAWAYLTIMKEQKWAKTIYFDGFAGSGRIEQNILYAPMPENSLFGELVLLPNQPTQDGMLKGTALRILDIVDPKPFDMYYFVEKDEDHFNELFDQVKTNYPNRNAYVVKDDCNKKLVGLAGYLKEHKEYRVLAFIDPYGMSVKWSSIEELKGLGVDLWILVPTGVGANRMLVKDGNISESWLNKLEIFLGIDGNEIKKLFYRQKPYSQPLFDNEEAKPGLIKDQDAINKLGKLYTRRLKEVFKEVSEPFVMRNSKNSIMYHFMMATNNKSALKIANDVIKPKYKL